MNIWDRILESAMSAGIKIAMALAVYLIGAFVIKKLMKAIPKGKLFSRMDPTGRSFALNFIKIALYVLLLISVISILGVPMASIIAVLASAGVAVGLALQGALGNLAGGIMLMFLRPFSVGHYINAAGTEGTVKSITMFYTILTSIDNKEITIPNGSLMNSNVVNFSSQELRRVDIEFSCGRDENMDKVLDILNTAISSNEKILKDPAPLARLFGSTKDALTFITRSWVKAEDYWDVYFGLHYQVHSAFDAAGIKAPATRVVNDSGETREE